MHFWSTMITLTTLATVSIANGQSLNAPFDASYAISDLGTPPSVPGPLGGLFVRAEDPATLLIGGAANSASAKIYAVTLVRGKDGHIISFAPEPATIVATAPGIGGGGIDGGLAIGPGGVLFYTAYNGNDVGQIKPGSTAPDLLTDLTSIGVASSVGTLAFVPPGFNNAGKLKLASYNASIWYSSAVSPNGDGTFAIAKPTTPIAIGGGPEGILFVEAGNPEFAVNSVLISQYAAANVVAYDLDANSDPIVATKRTFISGVGGAEGAARDPLTGDYLFSTFQSGDRVLVVRGFAVSCPADLNGDGAVGPQDLALLLGDWGGTSSPADLDSNGVVGASDLAIMLGAWGPCS
ncbi:MAG: hypothetical protein SGJ09_10200 [Phycisphaerae bacterium]|nr:hypothetical protein [Phycisphaerae bacterium]MDZ4830552.1 hypothetical protein [Phycisphaerae bacterium]